MSVAFSAASDHRKPLPFEDLFVPLIVDARAGLRQKATPTQIALLADRAHASWEQYLLKRLSGAGSKAAFCQFQVFKTVRSAFPATTGLQPADRLYREFVGVYPKERLGKLFDEFPALAKYSEVLISNWIATVAEFLSHFEADHGYLDANFAGGSFLGPVVSLQADLSDPHHGGRCVARVTFEGGTSLIYKPRSVASEARFFDFLEQLNMGEIPHTLRSAKCWERSGYGWMENVVPRPCGTLAEVHAFYWRAGALLALVYLVRGVDMHRENLISAGEFPILIDLETLWHPQEHAGATESSLATSVIRTGFLPQNNLRTSVIHEWNALSHRQDTDFLASAWVSVNEDKMMLAHANRSFQTSYHLPIFAGTEYLAGDFISDILAGFRWIGEQVLQDHQKREDFQQWIQVLIRCPRRRILRSSQRYQTILEHLVAPSMLRKKRVVKGDLAHFARSDFSITEAEWKAVQQLEIPWFEQEITLNHNQDNSPLARTPEELQAQESLIIDALSSP